MNYLVIKNWADFQHYKDRNPPWIKLHRSLLDDYEFCALDDAVKGQLMLIWLFASQNEGRIPQDANFLERKLGLTGACALDLLIQNGFLIPEHDASKPLARRKQGDSKTLALARSRESENKNNTKATETDTREAFAKFWEVYPRKVARSEAEKAWRKVSPGEREAVMAGLRLAATCEQWKRDDGKFIPHAATWLNQRRWEDEPDAVNGQSPLAAALAQMGHSL